MLAVRQCNRGFFHNLAKTPSSIPEGVIPDDSWATTDYHTGDVLILTPCTPHAIMPNTSHRCRVTTDPPVRSAADPRVLPPHLVAADPDGLRLLTTHSAGHRLRAAHGPFHPHKH